MPGIPAISPAALDSRRWLRAYVAVVSAFCFGAANAADVLVQQVERAQVQRDIQESQTTRVLPPARLDSEPVPGVVEAAAHADQRWRSLLSGQQSEINRPDAPPGAPVRALTNDRQQRAGSLADRIFQQDRDSSIGGRR